MSTAVTLTIDGQQYAPSEASWLVYAPCGCVSGAMDIQIGDQLILTEQDFLRAFYPMRRDPRRARDSRFEIRPRGEFMARAGRCPHTPQWGREEVTR